jgi:RNA polymerase sigma-70 factor (ECF subfamily)
MRAAIDGTASGDAPAAGARPPELPSDLLRAPWPRLEAAARRILRDDEDARDAVQNACEKALRHAASFRGDARPSTWLHRIVVNEALMLLRRRRRRAALLEVACDELAPAAEPAPDETLHATRRRARVACALAALPPRQRRVIERCTLAGESYEELARRDGERPGAVKARAFRARRRLAALLVEA